MNKTTGPDGDGIEKSKTSLSQIKLHDACHVIVGENKRERETGSVGNEEENGKKSSQKCINSSFLFISFHQENKTKLTSRVPS